MKYPDELYSEFFSPYPSEGLFTTENFSHPVMNDSTTETTCLYKLISAAIEEMKRSAPDPAVLVLTRHEYETLKKHMEMKPLQDDNGSLHQPSGYLNGFPVETYETKEAVWVRMMQLRSEGKRAIYVEA